MFTVLICDKHIIDDCHNKYYVYLKPFLDDESFAFCQWNTEGESLDEALPKLKNIIRSKKEWRAIIVNDSSTWDFNSVDKRNPFNFVDSYDKDIRFENAEQIISYRALKQKTVEKALSNPLVSLALWLCGSPVKEPVPNEFYDRLAGDIEDGDSYFKALEEKGLSAEDAEEYLYRKMRYEKLSETFDMEGELFNPPVSVYALSERARDVEFEEADSAWKQHTEFDYSHFYTDNLYPDKLRYLLQDIYYIKGVRNEGMYFDFLTSILILAVNEFPGGVLRPNRVYKLNVEVDSQCVKELCINYSAKLSSTIRKIDTISMRLSQMQKNPIDRETAEECFEKDVTVPVSTDKTFNEENLMSNYDRIGLTEEPEFDGYKSWSDRYNAINTLFLKFLREPRRAVKEAVKKDFRRLNSIDDERALRLSDYQKENLEEYLYEKEQSMIDTSAIYLYDTEKFKEKMEIADKNVRSSIRRCMTKRRTICVTLIGVLAYFIGFLPMFASNLNTVNSFLFSLGIAAIMTALFAVVAILYLFVLRDRLVKVFQEFNGSISDIYSEIRNSMGTFSTYLSNTCNVMREFSVLNYTKNSFEKRQNILQNHKDIINGKIKEVHELFYNYLDESEENTETYTEPYNYDFTKLEDYTYEMPYSRLEKNIEFMQEGNYIPVPVDYIRSVMVTREELYD